MLLFHINAFANNDPTVLLLGDSLSAGYGVEPSKSWPHKLSNKLAEFNISLINASISGETTSVGLNKLPNLLNEYKPKLLIIALGSNDGLRALPIQLIKNNLNKMIMLATESNSTIALIGFKMPANYGNYAIQFSKIFPDIAKDNPSIIYIPFFLEDFADDLSYFQSDTIHPNEKAQDIIFDAVYSKLTFLEGLKKD